MRKAGKHVAAISVFPPDGRQDIRSRLKAQDEQDVLVNKLGIDCGVSVEAFDAQKEFEMLQSQKAVSWRRDPQALPDTLLGSSKTLVHVPPVSKVFSLADLRRFLVTGALEQQGMNHQERESV